MWPTHSSYEGFEGMQEKDVLYGSSNSHVLANQLIRSDKLQGGTSDLPPDYFMQLL